MAKKGKVKDPMIGKVIGDYKIIKLIAEGGFGKTYKARELSSDSIDCLKDCSNVDADLAYVLKKEYKSIRDLRHFGLPSMRRLIPTTDGKYALVMSYVPGKTLEQCVEKLGKLKPETVAWITDRLLNILKYMHLHGVMHGDIKPQNIIIQPEDHTVVLIDFGLAMVKPKSGDENLGYTELYAPPEQLEGKLLLPESDLYSLAKVMIYALGGGEDKVRKLELADFVPDALRNFIIKLLPRDVSARPHWGKRGEEDICDSFRKVRMEAFGRIYSNMEPSLLALLNEKEEEDDDV